MGGKDSAVKSKIAEILQGNSIGKNMRAYFENMPEKNIRRSIFILSTIYPDKRIVSNEEFTFISYIFSNKKFIVQESFHELVCSINMIDFTDCQKAILISKIQGQFDLLCEQCTFELDTLLVRLLTPGKLIQYLEGLLENAIPAVLQHILDILRYEDFSDGDATYEALARLRQSSSEKLLRKTQP